METKLRDFFEANCQRLREEGGHALSEYAKEEAWEQVLWYWRRLQGLAKKVTETEVRLSLPSLKTPAGRPFSIDGIVDIIREDGTAKMYDIKTHDLDSVNGNKELYEEQLNVYAHIWQGVRGNPLETAAVISTAFPKEMKQAIRARDEAKLKKEFEKWDPIVPIEIKKEKVAETIKAFGTVVDAIEDGQFVCPAPAKLKDIFPGTTKTFAYKVCLNCDGRYCCEAYRTYVSTQVSGRARELVKYFQKDFEKEQQEDWLESNTSSAEEAL
jgi:hypothetical protein